MPKKKYVVDLSTDERTELLTFIKKGHPGARKVTRAHILLLAGENRTDADIADSLHVGRATVERTRKKFVEGGSIESALNERRRCGASRKLDGAGTAFLIALACSQAPSGREKWTMQLLTDKLVELKKVDAISDETVRRRLNENQLKPWQKKAWCIPKVDAEFVWRMEDVLDLYSEPYDPQRPRVCFDESPYQMISQTRQPLPMQPGQPQRFDYEYRREGTRNLFMFVQPEIGWRHVQVTARRTKRDFAHCMQELVDVHFPEAEVVRVVLDNLNTHTPAALYETFDPAEARRIVSKLEFHFTPKHGSWLNMAEIEFSVLGGQCLGRRIGDEDTLKSEVAAWESTRNAQNATINWQFTTPKAREKLGRLYPS